MRRIIKSAVFVTAAVSLTACGSIRESRVNPMNWFNYERQEERLTPAGALETAQDIRPLISQVADMRIERAPGGAIVRATGLPQTQGFHTAELIEVETETRGLLAFEFKVVPPRPGAPVGSGPSREITVGTFVSDIALQGITAIEVRGQDNARRTRR
ncbi:hypothetical protein [Nereida sp. NH-UV-3]|uniref:hypothetical protein n=1 Tax=Nereida TaxID=282198 RepID=UPI0036F30AD2